MHIGTVLADALEHAIGQGRRLGGQRTVQEAAASRPTCVHSAPSQHMAQKSTVASRQ